MPTVHEAKKLECRQASTYLDGEFHFPRCSATSCAHWRMLRETEHLTVRRVEVDIRRKNAGESDLPMSDAEWNEHIEQLLADGWTIQSGTGGKGLKGNWYNTQFLSRPLPPEQQTGECGLIANVDVEVHS